LLLPKTLDEKRWQEIGAFLAHVGGSVMWWIGDWWRFGDEHGYGERYVWAAANGLNEQTCMNAASVARGVETSRRREVLSWSHHAEVAALEPEEQERFLDKAEREEWSRNDLRAAVHHLATPDSTPHVAKNSGENEWYTPEQYVAAAREVMGTIDLDPASSPAANEIVQAQDFYTADDNGLEQEWGGRLWMNPPYAVDLIGKFTDKMADSYAAGGVSEAIVLVNNATETQWFQRLARSAKAICFPERRVRFWSPDGVLGAPLQGQAFVYLGVDSERFADQFSAFGLIVEVRAA